MRNINIRKLTALLLTAALVLTAVPAPVYGSESSAPARGTESPDGGIQPGDGGAAAPDRWIDRRAADLPTTGIQPAFSNMSAAEFKQIATEDTYGALLKFDGDLPRYVTGAPALPSPRRSRALHISWRTMWSR